MSQESKEEKLFNEIVDRLLAGESVTIDAADDDLRSAIGFVRKMKQLRAAPSEQFKVNLKARLLQQLRERETQTEKTSWLRRNFPRRIVWQLATTVAVILIALGISWRAGVFQTVGRTNTASVPPKSAGSSQEVTPGPTLMMTSTTTASTTTPLAATAGRGMIIQANATTDKTTYLSGEVVTIDVSLVNDSSELVEIRPYPPVLAITDANGQTVYTFGAGYGVVVWNQLDAQGKYAPSGTYYLSLGNLAYDNQSAQLELISR